MASDPDIVPIVRNVFKEDLDNIVLLLNASNVVTKAIPGAETSRPVFKDYLWTIYVERTEFDKASVVISEYLEYLNARDNSPPGIELCTNEVVAESDASSDLEWEAEFKKDLEDAKEDESSAACPRCLHRKVSYPDEPFFWIMILSIVFLFIPLLIFFIIIHTKGTRRKCTACMHEWRAKP
ncbi:MAG: hypothetical protein SFY80_01950 [Verrucomicrobiota bacterium]|nr:hypothetical protein [Verrucomicrobiota bacterium]